jgi:hypothetical protein
MTLYMRQINQNKKVVLLAHSLGNNMSMYLFHKHGEWASENLAAYLAGMFYKS